MRKTIVRHNEPSVEWHMVKVFFSYSHRDEELRDELEVHLAALKRQGVIETWHDRRIEAGQDIHREVDANINSCEIILLLVSPYFLASDYCYDVEMKRALERHEAGQARVISVILHPCDWTSTPFANLLATPTDGKPISKFANHHEAFSVVVGDIKRAAKSLSSKGTAPAPPEALLEEARHTVHVSSLATQRSSNLRVKREFTDHERDAFVDDSFELISNYFENSLAELSKRNEELSTRFKRVHAQKFTASIYQSGAKVSDCRVFRGDFVGDIAYAHGESGGENTYNESLSIVDDGYTLALRPIGLGIGRLRQDHDSELSQAGAAEYLWSMLIERLQ